MIFLKTLLSLLFSLYSFLSIGNSNNKDCFKAFLDENYNERSMKEHLESIKERGYPKELSNILISDFEGSTDVGLRGMIGRILGAYRIARNNKKRVVSLMIQTLNKDNTHYLERKGMVQGLGFLLRPEDQTAINELVKFLRDSSSAVRKETAVSLGKIKPKDESIEKALIERAKDSKEKIFVREAVIETLGEIIDPNNNKAIWDIHELLTDPESRIRKAASSALRKIDSNIYAVVQSLNIQELYQRHIEEKNKKFHNAPSPFGSWFAVRVFLAIHKKGYFVVPEFEFAANKTVTRTSKQRPYRIDLVVIGSGGKKLAVECDGNQHEYEENKENDMRRESELKSFGWEFYRIKHNNFYSQPDQVLEGLWMKMEEIGIKPFTKNKSFRRWPFRRFKK